jgi:hypothetical protein
MASSRNFRSWISGLVVLALLNLAATTGWSQSERQKARSAPPQRSSRPPARSSTPQRSANRTVTRPQATARQRSTRPQRSATSNRNSTSQRNHQVHRDVPRSPGRTQRSVTQPRTVTPQRTRPNNVQPRVRVSPPNSAVQPRVITPRQRVDHNVRVQPPTQSTPQVRREPSRSVVRMPSIISRRENTSVTVHPGRSQRVITSPRRRESSPVVIQPRPRSSQPPTRSGQGRSDHHIRNNHGPTTPQHSHRDRNASQNRRPHPPKPVVAPREVKRRLRQHRRPDEVRVDANYRQHYHRPYAWRRHRRPSLAYCDRPHINHNHHYVHSYRDRWHRWHQCVVTPRYSIGLRYHWGRHNYRRYIYPFYHRKYVFVSLGGYWPIGNLALRYYWYGWHPYEWYGYNPVAYQLDGTTNNYYTYNYYDADASLAGQSITVSSTDDQILDSASPPAAQGPADVHFEVAVKAFEQADYRVAQEHLEEAMELDRDDLVLPFAYVQVLFAQARYEQACMILREAYARKDWNRDSVYFPRGLYDEDKVLFDQIDLLVDLAEAKPHDSDLQLLLGYQLLGVGELESAMAPLTEARKAPRNVQTADALLDVLVRIQSETVETN